MFLFTEPVDLIRTIRSLRHPDQVPMEPEAPLRTLAKVFHPRQPIHPAIQEMADAVRLWLEHPQLLIDESVGKALLLTVDHIAGWLAERVGWDRVIGWLVEMGPVVLLIPYDLSRGATPSLQLGTFAEQTRYVGVPYAHRWLHTGMALAMATDAGWQTAVQTAQRFRPLTTAAGRAGIAMAMPDRQDWVHDALRESPDLAQWLVPISTDHDLIRAALVDTPFLEQPTKDQVWPVWRARMGAAGALELARRLALAPGAATLAWQGAREHDDAISTQIALHLHDHPALRQEIGTWLMAHPEQTLGALLAPDAPEIPGMLRRLCQARPEDARRLAAAVGCEDRVSAHLTAPVDDAPTSQLPAVLQDPPWRRRRKSFKRLEFRGLGIPDPPATMSAEPPPPHPGTPWQFGKVQPAPLPPELIRAPAGRTLQPVHLHAALLMPEPDRAALGRVFAQVTPDNLHHHQYEEAQLHHLVPLLGIHALPGLLQIAESSLSMCVGSLARFDHPRVALHMARALARLSARRRVARRWLRHHPQTAIAGLVPAALGPIKPASAKKDRLAAEAALRELASTHNAEILQVAAGYGPEAAAAIESWLARSPYEDFTRKPGPVSALVRNAGLTRPVLISGGSLPEDAMLATCELLAVADVDQLYIGLADILAACTRESLARFGHDLLELWSLTGFAADLNWVLPALGLLGDDHTVDALEPLILAWPHESAHRRAKLALAVLGTIGTEHALRRLHHLSCNGTGKSQRKEAAAQVARLAEARGTTVEALG